MKYSLAYTASSPFVSPRISLPPTYALARRSRLRSCVLSGSLKDPDGGERKGGGKGRGVRFAKSATPVSKRKGSFGNVEWEGAGLGLLSLLFSAGSSAGGLEFGYVTSAGGRASVSGSAGGGGAALAHDAVMYRLRCCSFARG